MVKDEREMIKEVEEVIKIAFPTAEYKEDDEGISVEVPTSEPYFSANQLGFLSEMFRIIQEFLDEKQRHSGFVKIESVDAEKGIKFKIVLFVKKLSSVPDESTEAENEEEGETEWKKIEEKVKNLSDVLILVGYDSFSHEVEVKVKECDDDTFKSTIALLREKRGRFDKNTKTWILKKEVLE